MRWRFGAIWIGLSALIWFKGCALAPAVFEHPPIFKIAGDIALGVQPDGADLGDDEAAEQSDPKVYYVVLSWYLFVANGLTESPWALAGQTEVVLSEGTKFTVELIDEPPEESFLPAGQGRILKLPADGRMAIGFLTVFRPGNEGMEFSWRASLDGGTICPYEDKLIVWWDGPELDGQEIGIDSGRLVRGLNILDISADNEDQETYALLDAQSPMSLPECRVESRGALRSCGIPGDRGVVTLLPGFEDYPTQAPEIEFECFGCGSFYEIPNQCSRVLDVLCRECHSTTVHAYPDEVPDFWPCLKPAEPCSDDDDDHCGLGFKFSCIDEQWVLVSQCEDACCEHDCVSVESDGESSSDTVGASDEPSDPDSDGADR